MIDQATRLRGLVETQTPSAERPQSPPSQSSLTHRYAKSIAITSGKGGVGKSHVALNLAVAYAEAGHSVCLLDANHGLGNQDLLCGLNAYWNTSHVLSGSRSLEEVLLRGPGGIQLLSGADGIVRSNQASEESFHSGLLEQFLALESGCDYLIIDTSPGLSPINRQLFAACDGVVVLTTPEPTSLADSYALLKSLNASEINNLAVIVNQTESLTQSQSITLRLEKTTRTFLQKTYPNLGSLPRDPQVQQAVFAARPFLSETPQAPVSRALFDISRRIAHWTDTTSKPNQSFFAACLNRQKSPTVRVG